MLLTPLHRGPYALFKGRVESSDIFCCVFCVCANLTDLTLVRPFHSVGIRFSLGRYCGPHSQAAVPSVDISFDSDEGKAGRRGVVEKVQVTRELVDSMNLEDGSSNGLAGWPKVVRDARLCAKSGA